MKCGANETKNVTKRAQNIFQNVNKTLKEKYWHGMKGYIQTTNIDMFGRALKITKEKP